MRVFWYCEKWEPGGIQKLQTGLLPYLDRDKVRLEVAACEDDTALFDGALRAAGVQRLTTLQKRYRSPGLRTAANFFALRHIMKAGSYDAVHFNACHGVEAIYLFWAFLYRVPVRILHARNNGIGAGGKTRPIKVFCHLLCKHLFGGLATVRLANSDLAARWLFPAREVAGGRVRIVKNGIAAQAFAFDPEKRAAARRALGLENALVIGHIGHFTYQKNHPFLLNVFAEIARRNPRARLLLIGKGPGEQAAREQAKRLGVSERVIFCGVVSDVAPLLFSMDAFVLPSRFEGFGNVLLEAQAAGLPCFASRDVIPSAAAVTPLLHWISLQEGPEKWAKEILVQGVCEARRSFAQEIIDAGYDIARMAKELQEIYCGEGDHP